MIAEKALHLPILQRIVKQGFLHFISLFSGEDPGSSNEGRTLKIKILKLLKDILPYRLGGGKIPEDLSFLNEREEKFF